MFRVMRAFYRAGYLSMFDNIKLDSGDKYMGALTAQCPLESQFKVLKNVAQFDYASLYPNACIDLNISPETFASESAENTKTIDLNY